MWDKSSIARRLFFSATTSIHIPLPHRGHARHGGYCKLLTDVHLGNKKTGLLCRATAANVKNCQHEERLMLKKPKVSGNTDGPRHEAEGGIRITAPSCATGASIAHHHVPSQDHGDVDDMTLMLISSMTCWSHQEDHWQTWQIFSHLFHLIRPFSFFFFLTPCIHRHIHHVFIVHSKDNLDSTWNFNSRKQAGCWL